MAGDAEDRRMISAFLDAQAAESGAARNTLLAYGRDLADFTGWLAGRDLGLRSMTRENVEEYLTHCDDLGLSRATRARRLSAIRQWTRFALEEGWREDDPAGRIAGPGRAQRLPKTLSRDEVQAMLDALPRLGRTEVERRRTKRATPDNGKHRLEFDQRMTTHYPDFRDTLCRFVSIITWNVHR